MKNLKTILAILFIGSMLTSCADGKEININGKDTYVEPYGWYNVDEKKNDSVIYEVNTGNVVWSILSIETIVIPLYLTGTGIYEPVGKK